jgi:para-aminobenzoate synthetase component 1
MPTGATLPLQASTLLPPTELATRLHGGGGLVWLDTAVPDATSLSILASQPVEVLTGNIFRDAPLLRRVLQQYHRPHVPDLGAPSGGLFGWVGFDGQFIFGVYPQCHVYQHGSGTWMDASSGRVAAPASIAARTSTGTLLELEPLMNKETFCGLVERAQQYIAAGDIYQVNLSYPWTGEWPGDLDPLTFYLKLRDVSPAPFAAYLDLASMQVCSASPECFLKMSGSHIITRPIKGTRPRGQSRDADHQLANELMHSPKERAELVMITDLERNDIGRVCEYGSVQVTQLLHLEKHAQVHHLVSTVEGTLRGDVDQVEAFLACFPGGSISGAPKKRALEIIHELEPHERGLYTGAIGFFGFNGESQFSIAIRTAWRRSGRMHFHTGAGIVADSDPAHEWEETRHKAAGLLAAAQGV